MQMALNSANGNTKHSVDIILDVTKIPLDVKSVFPNYVKRIMSINVASNIQCRIAVLTF